MKSEIWNLKSDIWNLESEIWNLKSKIWNLKFKIWNLKSEISNLKSEIWNLESEIWNLESGIWNLKSEIWNLESEVWNHAYTQTWRKSGQTAAEWRPSKPHLRIYMIGGTRGTRGKTAHMEPILYHIHVRTPSCKHVWGTTRGRWTHPVLRSVDFIR